MPAKHIDKVRLLKVVAAALSGKERSLDELMEIVSLRAQVSDVDVLEDNGVILLPMKDGKPFRIEVSEVQ